MRSTDEFRRSATGPGPAPAAPGIVVGRRTLLGACAVGLLVTGWAAVASWQLVAGRDGAGTPWRAAEARYAYDDRIGQLSDTLERTLTQNLVERNAFEARVAALATRQAEIEARQSWLRGIAERVAAAGRGSTVVPVPSRPTDAGLSAPAGPARPAPLPSEPALRLRDGRTDDAQPGRPARDRLSVLERAAERIGTEEIRLLGDLGHGTRLRVARLRSAIDAAGVNPDRAGASGRAPALGGPLVELPAGLNRGSGLDALASDVRHGFSELLRLRLAASALPLGSPLAEAAEQTSGFGYRIDPFTRAAALHTGIDFRSEFGTLARATGSGTVVAAEYVGGYGLMVEVAHEGGVSTRYGHLSAIAVALGERVEAGRVLGRTGSTGRSTGPHLHYETRLNGEPVDPTRFLDAGRRLADEAG